MHNTCKNVITGTSTKYVYVIPGICLSVSNLQ